MTVIRKYHGLNKYAETLVTQPMIISDGTRTRIVKPPVEETIVYVNPREWQRTDVAKIHVFEGDVIDPRTGEVIL